MQASSEKIALPALTFAEFEQLARDVFTLVQRDRAAAEIDVAALTGKAFIAQPNKASLRIC